MNIVHRGEVVKIMEYTNCKNFTMEVDIDVDAQNLCRNCARVYASCEDGEIDEARDDVS